MQSRRATQLQALQPEVQAPLRGRTSRRRESVPDSWRTWIAENLALDVAEEAIVAELMAANISESAARDELAAAVSHPYLKAARRLRARLEKLESMMNVRARSNAQSFAAGTIERRSKISEAEFLERYYAPGRPVILTGLLRDQAAFKRWTPDYLSARCGDARVEIMTERDRDPRYERNSTAHKASVRFGDYIARIVAGGASNDAYLVANNGFFARPEAHSLFSEVPKFPLYVQPNTDPEHVFFWFGPAGTVTPLHHDVMNVLLAQLRGRKRITLIAPDQTHLLYNDVGVYSAVDCENPDYERYPRFRGVRPVSLVLAPGEVLFIPVGHWHHVRSLDISISISYTRFKYPNDYTWSQPNLSY